MQTSRAGSDGQIIATFSATPYRAECRGANGRTQYGLLQHKNQLTRISIDREESVLQKVVRMVR